jgi:hypothetical protein
VGVKGKDDEQHAITNRLTPISVDGNATLQVVMTDKGEPGSSDAVGITIWNKTGGLWFASKWDGTKTVEQLLGRGKRPRRRVTRLLFLPPIPNQNWSR